MPILLLVIVSFHVHFLLSYRIVLLTNLLGILVAPMRCSLCLLSWSFNFHFDPEMLYRAN
jgi:hypothetical protein